MATTMLNTIAEKKRQCDSSGLCIRLEANYLRDVSLGTKTHPESYRGTPGTTDLEQKRSSGSVRHFARNIMALGERWLLSAGKDWQ